MKWLLCLLLASCGGGGGAMPASGTNVPPAPQTVAPSATYDWRDYSGLRASYDASGWRSVQTGPASFNIYWGPTWEEQRIATNPADGNRPWVFVDAYAAPGIRYEIRVTRAELNRLDGRGWVNILPVSDPRVYLPAEIGPAGAITRQWGWIYLDGNPIKRFFWYSLVKPNPQGLYNSCWTLNEATRPTLIQQEAWWDTGGDNWTDRGRGEIDPATREPSGEGIQFFYYIHNARMVPAGDGQLHGGYAWQYGYNGQPTGCAQF